ncbi:membrane-associated sensor domain-containing protein [Aeromonas allosaccharophila]|uniref:membrane-associated sensor domain-containing protein n=1 Tax=Aeromonas allosaccharophila TaxID=656 RepID=UPI0027D8006B|nr:membrane-associated sensor domain-containing protein [Aeromonas allosaccharophila]
MHLLLVTGRRMLYRWFVLAVAREYENLALACWRAGVLAGWSGQAGSADWVGQSPLLQSGG